MTTTKDDGQQGSEDQGTTTNDDGLHGRQDLVYNQTDAEAPMNQDCTSQGYQRGCEEPMIVKDDVNNIVNQTSNGRCEVEFKQPLVEFTDEHLKPFP